MHSLPYTVHYSDRSTPSTPPTPLSPTAPSHSRKLRKPSRTFVGRGAPVLPPTPPPMSRRDSHHPLSSEPSLVTRVFCWIRSLRPRLSSRFSRRQSALPKVDHRDQGFLESLVRYTEDASYRSHTHPLASCRSQDEYTTDRVGPSNAYPTSRPLTPRPPNLTHMSYIRSPHPPSSYHSCSYYSTSRPHPHANHPANSWYSSDSDDPSDNPDLGTDSRSSDHTSLFYRPIKAMAPDSPRTTQPRPSGAMIKTRPEPLKITPVYPIPTPIQVTPWTSMALPAPPRQPSITLSILSANGECEKLAFPTPPAHPPVIHKPKRSSGHWFAGHAVFIPSSKFSPDLRAYENEEWMAEMVQSYGTDSILSCQAAEDVQLGSRSTSATIFTHETAMTPTIDLPTPSSATFGLGLNSVSAHLWGRQAQLKHDLSLDESQSDFSGNTLPHHGLGFDDEDAEFVSELESVYSAFADLSMSSAGGGPVRLSTVFGTDDIMSDAESVTDPHLHSAPLRIPPPRAWMAAA